MIKEQDRIVLKAANPAEGLEAGDVGMVAHMKSVYEWMLGSSPRLECVAERY
jgi:hypothetical protein